jgi:hypothetical protein
VIKYSLFYLAGFLISCNSNIQMQEQKNIAKTDTVFKEKEYPIISDSTNILENKTETLELQYTVWGCACANWITATYAKKKDDGNFQKKHIFIEPANSTLYYPDSTFDFGKENIVVTGQFYQREDYPQGTRQFEERLEKAKVFRYTKIKVIKKK